VRVVTGSLNPAQGTLDVFVNGDRVVTGAHSTGVVLLDECYAELPLIEVQNPTTDGWIGSIEFSLDGTCEFLEALPAACTTGCTEGTCAHGEKCGPVVADGNGDGGQYSDEIVCLNGARCSYTPRGSSLEDITVPGDVVVAFPNPNGGSPDGEGAANAIDNDIETKYLNSNRLNTGLTIDRAGIIQALALTSGNDQPGRDPASFILYGSSDGASYVEIASGDIPAFHSRYQRQIVPVDSTGYFSSFRIIFPTVAGEVGPDCCSWCCCCMQIAELELLGTRDPGTACTRPTAWCTHSGAVYTNVDCDGDGFLDHHCVGGGNEGSIRSGNNCVDDWPSGQGNCAGPPISDDGIACTASTEYDTFHMPCENVLKDSNDAGHDAAGSNTWIAHEACVGTWIELTLPQEYIVSKVGFRQRKLEQDQAARMTIDLKSSSGAVVHSEDVSFAHVNVDNPPEEFFALTPTTAKIVRFTITEVGASSNCNTGIGFMGAKRIHVYGEPGHCFDGTQNEDETGTDCGGSSCTPCTSCPSFEDSIDYYGNDCNCMRTGDTADGQYELGITSAESCSALCASYGVTHFAFWPSPGKCWCIHQLLGERQIPGESLGRRWLHVVAKISMERGKTTGTRVYTPWSRMAAAGCLTA
jgi:hypothetical protein